MLKKITGFKMFLVAASTFMTLELADSPLRSLSYLSIFMVASSNLWMQAENTASRRAS